MLLLRPHRLVFKGFSGLRQFSSFDHFPYHNRYERKKAVSELLDRGAHGEGSWSFMVESMIAHIGIEGRVRYSDVLSLMQSCKADTIDLFPKDQKSLTINAWDAVKQANLTEKEKDRDVSLYCTALEAFLFQEIPIDEEDFISDMEKHRIWRNVRVDKKFLAFHCKNKDIEKALQIIEEKNKGPPEGKIVLDEGVASKLILCYASRGEFKEAYKILTSLNMRKINYGRSVPNAFVLGAASAGDVFRLTELIKQHQPHDQVLLDALLELNKVAPDQLDAVLDFLPKDKTKYSKPCRRAVKKFIENNQLEVAEKLILKMEPLPEDRKDQEYSHSCFATLPGILTHEIVKQETDPIKLFQKIEVLSTVDDTIFLRTIALLLELCLTEPDRKRFCESAVKTLMQTHCDTTLLNNMLNRYVGPLVMNKVKDAETDNDIFLILKVASDLGIKLQDNEWAEALLYLIPRDREYTVSVLYGRVKLIREVLDGVSKREGGMYSTSVIHSHIFRHLFGSKDEVFFKTASARTRQLGVIYGPKRWFQQLGYSLLDTRDAESYVDILEVAVKNSIKRGDGEDLIRVGLAINVAINVANKHDENIEILLGTISAMIVERRLTLHWEVKEKMLLEVKGTETEALVNSVPVLDTGDFRTKRPFDARMRILKPDGKPRRY